MQFLNFIMGAVGPLCIYAFAQSYPTKPVRILVPLAAGMSRLSRARSTWEWETSST
jgi:hypothetical protein